MVEENISQEKRWKNIDETRNYFVEKVDQNGLMSKKVCSIFVRIILNTFLF